jgi:hypothetical protein
MNRRQGTSKNEREAFAFGIFVNAAGIGVKRPCYKHGDIVASTENLVNRACQYFALTPVFFARSIKHPG